MTEAREHEMKFDCREVVADKQKVQQLITLIRLEELKYLCVFMNILNIV